MFCLGLKSDELAILDMQYKGGAAEGGRRPSIWNIFTHQHPGMLIASLPASCATYRFVFFSFLG
jgi:hypothetical protein